MIWDATGDKHFGSSLEAIQFLRDSTRGTVRWLHECRETKTMLHFPQYRSLLNDIANVTIRWIEHQERQITDLQEQTQIMRERLQRLQPVEQARPDEADQKE